MKSKFIRLFSFFILCFPFVFVLLFFGYATPKFDIVLYTDNIVGEGLGYTYLCPLEEYAYEYRAGFYFGSQLKTITIPGFHYDVTEFCIEVSDVTEAEFYGFDVKAFGINLGYYDMRDQFVLGHYGGEEDGVDISLSADGQRLHVDFQNPNTTTSLKIHNQYIPTWLWVVYWLILSFFTLLTALGMSIIWDRFPMIRIHFVSASGIAATMIIGCLICGSLPYVEYLDFLLNYIILCAAALLLNSLTLPFVGTVLTMAFAMIWYIANYFVIAYRNKPIMPADLKAVTTVREVISGYTLTINQNMLLGVMTVLMFSIASVIVWHSERRSETNRKKQWLRRCLGVITAVVLFFACANNVVFSHLNSFQWDNKLLKSFHSEGMVLTFLKAEANFRVVEPSGYDRETVQTYLSEYSVQSGTEGLQPTNIIMVMNEAFSDLRTIGLDPCINVMPFIDSLDDNTTEGRLAVSVFGGGTCNTEFEALTGNTLAFFSAGAYPYTENVTKSLFSLASYFKELGYSTEAFHANNAKNWNRDVVYPNLGFNLFHSIHDYPTITDELELHNEPADIADYLYMEKRVREVVYQPRFFFNVTMQNHSPYDRWEDVEKAEGLDSLYFDTEVYLSLVKASDKAIQQLVETYRDFEEPTMIIFFGDHLPGLPSVSYNELSTGIAHMDRFMTKFFIWANYETESLHDTMLSANYLPWLILERGNFPLPPYIQMLKELHEKYPVISSQGVIDAEGTVYPSINEILDDPLIRKYQYVQYANLFDQIDDAWFSIE